LAREGLGAASAWELSQQGVQWHTSRNDQFDGTTIVPKNDMVDRHNNLALTHVPGRPFVVQSRRWGRQRGEWKLVPDRLELKLGAYVMVLSNSPLADGAFEYVNGDCGHVVDIDAREQGIYVELVRTGKTIYLGKLCRDSDQRDKPDGWSGNCERTPFYLPEPHRNLRKHYVHGQVEYYPLRLAYATTVHKSQSLSLDRVQIDFRHGFFKQPGMEYVAISRCRTLEGLRMVGQPEVWARHCNTDPRVRGYL
jgi:hypothetical protein